LLEEKRQFGREAFQQGDDMPLWLPVFPAASALFGAAAIFALAFIGAVFLNRFRRRMAPLHPYDYLGRTTTATASRYP
jgi:hypothetical protein